MSSFSSRRNLLKGLAGGALLSGIPLVSSADAQVDPDRVRLDSGIEPLVRFLEKTPRGKLLEEVAVRIKQGLSYQELLTALFLAGVRNFRPHGGDHFHAVLVIHAAHQASLSAPDSDRWLPLFWALDEFKRVHDFSGSWRMEPIDDAKVPSARQARQALRDAFFNWDVAAGEAAVVGLIRSAGAGEIFDQLALHGACNFGFLGHNAIFVANGWRTLQTIGWQHAEPVLRSLTRVVFELAPHRVWKGNRELASQMPAEWQEGKLDSEVTEQVLELMRKATPEESSRLAFMFVKGGIAPQSIWDALFAGVGELLMRQPAQPGNWQRGIYSLHAATLMNALHYAYTASSQDETRRLLFLQSAAVVPHFLETMRQRGGEVARGRIDELEPAPLAAPAAEAAGEIFAEVSSDRGLAARKALAWLKDHPQPQELINAARQLVFLKGVDTHDYKFSTAVFEDYHHISPAWRDRYLASSMYILRGTGDRDNALVSRTRTALGS